MRCSAEFGQGEIVDIEVDEWVGRETKRQKTKVWRLKKISMNKLREILHIAYLSVMLLRGPRSGGVRFKGVEREEADLLFGS